MSYLFGDILAVSRTDLIVVWGGAFLVLGLLASRWQALLASTLNADLAFASGVNPKREQIFLTIGLAIVVAVSIKVVGALLIGSMLLIPASAARSFARTPEAMAFIAAAIGVVSVFGGLAASYIWDTPTGPTIVSVAAGIFLASTFVRVAARD
jgi:zinc transport system permease protein